MALSLKCGNAARPGHGGVNLLIGQQTHELGAGAPIFFHHVSLHAQGIPDRLHIFDVVVLNERFGTRNPDMNNILKYLDRLGISIRRNIFVALLTNRFRTMDYMAAFNKSVNLIVNLKNVDDI